MGEDRHESEVFDALAHPARIKILKMLKEDVLSFGELKIRLGIESSGHLQHHLGKLGDLVSTDEHGRYWLSEQGRDALFAMQTIENMSKEPKKVNSHSRKFGFRRFYSSVIVMLAIVAVIGGLYVSYAGFGQPQYIADVMTGSPLKSWRTVSSDWFDVAPGQVHEYTATVYSIYDTQRPNGSSYSYVYAGTYDVPPQIINSTYYSSGYLSFTFSIMTDDNAAQIKWGPVTGPSGWNGEEVTEWGGIPSYPTEPIERIGTTTIGSTLGGGTFYLIPITVFGNYTFQINNVGDYAFKTKFQVQAPVVTLETRPLRNGETFSSLTSNQAGARIVRVREETKSFPFDAALLIATPIAIMAIISVYAKNHDESEF